MFAHSLRDVSVCVFSLYFFFMYLILSVHAHKCNAGCVPCTKMDPRPVVKVSGFRHAPPSGSCSIDSYKQDLRKHCAVLPCMADRQPGLKNMSPCATHITHSLAATPAPLPWQSLPQNHNSYHSLLNAF